MGRVPDPMPELAALYLDPRTKQIAPEWLRWLTIIRTLLGAAPQVVASGSLTNQSAAIPTTSLSMPALVGGVYRLNLYLHETQAAGGNSKTTLLSQMLLIRADANTPITYSTTYSSSGTPSMTYEVAMIVEQM